MPISRSDLRNRLRGLSKREYRAFLSALWTARGWEVRDDESGLSVRRGDEQLRAIVVADPQSLVRLLSDRSIDMIVLAPGIWETLGRKLVGMGPGREPTPDVIDSDDVYELLTFAIDSETRRAIQQEFLGNPTWRLLGRRATDRLLGPLRTSRATRLMGVVLIVSLVAATTVGVPVLLNGGAEQSQTSPVTTGTPHTETESVPTASQVGIPAPCPPPPAGVHPSRLRPAIRPGASAGGLDGWKQLLTQNISRYDFDPNDQTAEVVPEERHIAVYRTPVGSRYRFIADRWESDERAESARATSPGDIATVWGRYVLAVETGTSTRATSATARELLSSVSLPGGPQLGAKCVARLLDNSSHTDK